MLLALGAAAGVLVVGVLGLWCQTRDEKRAALAKIIAEAAQAEFKRSADKADRGAPSPPEDYWSSMVGRLFVFTVARPREHAFVAAATRVLPRGIVVQDPLGESLFLNYENLQWRPATVEDARDPLLVITPDLEDEEEVEVV